MPKRNIVVLGASAGGVQPLIRLLARLPAGLPASLFVVLHVPASQPSALAEILGRAGPLPVRAAHHLEAPQRGVAYTAPPNTHLLLSEGKMLLGRGPREHGTRPAVDPLFRTAARTFGPRVIGIVLSGALDDGAAGLLEIKRRGGKTVVQDAQEALFPDMPANALAAAGADHSLPVSAIAESLGAWVEEDVAMSSSGALSGWGPPR